METLPKGYTLGTHRLVAPEQTLLRIKDHVRRAGVTRCADVTGLDRIGLPVYCAIRPGGRDVQVANGKGLSRAAAKVSALMEAIELFHADTPSLPFQRATLASLLRDRRRVVAPSLLQGYRFSTFFSPDYLIDWIQAEDLFTREEVWLPASAVHLCTPRLYDLSSNGLASGNHVVEATLHGLYEVIERDAITNLCAGGRLRFTRANSQIIAPDHVGDEVIRGLYEQLSRADVKLVLIRVKSPSPVHTFMAVLLDRNPLSYSTGANVGYGTHLSASVAAARAITEAAQSRLTYIHGAREDLKAAAYQPPRNYIYDFFDGLEGRVPWEALGEFNGLSLLDDYELVLRGLAEAGYRQVYRVDLTHPEFKIPVTKIFICGMKVDLQLF